MTDEKRKEKVMAELYDKISSEFYDYHAERGDIDFYVGFAIESGGPVLELGCGTGRVLIPTAKAGIAITGLEKSKEMLKICRDKLKNETTEVRSRTKLVNGDMRNFNFGSQFSMVMITFGPFNNLITTEEQINCLNCIRRNLKDNGTLVFDVYYISMNELTAPEGKEIFSVKTPFIMPDGRSVTWGISRRGAIDFNRQVMQDGLFYDIRHPDGHEERLVYTDPLRYFYRFEVEHLLARTGFKTEAVYADFNKEPFGSKYPSELIFLARKEKN
jgi:ubiquinone/menaquinone biosynthesis C-methylase UbiE